jgi:hypothetical protein
MGYGILVVTLGFALAGLGQLGPDFKGLNYLFTIKRRENFGPRWPKENCGGPVPPSFAQDRIPPRQPVFAAPTRGVAVPAASPGAHSRTSSPVPRGDSSRSSPGSPGPKSESELDAELHAPAIAAGDILAEARIHLLTRRVEAGHGVDARPSPGGASELGVVKRIVSLEPEL